MSTYDILDILIFSRAFITVPLLNTSQIGWDLENQWVLCSLNQVGTFENLTLSAIKSLENRVCLCCVPAQLINMVKFRPYG